MTKVRIGDEKPDKMTPAKERIMLFRKGSKDFSQLTPHAIYQAAVSDLEAKQSNKDRIELIKHYKEKKDHLALKSVDPSIPYAFLTKDVNAAASVIDLFDLAISNVWSVSVKMTLKVSVVMIYDDIEKLRKAKEIAINEGRSKK